MKKEFGLFALLLVLCIGTALKSPEFLSPINLQNTSKQVGMFGIFSIGIAFVIITGGIDLSVGSVMALIGVMFSIMLNDHQMSPIVGIVAMLGIGVIVGFFHAGMITKARMQPFIVTLGGLMLYRGLARYIANDESKGFGQVQGFDAMQAGFMDPLLGIPVPFIMLVLISIVMWFVLHRSVYGRHLFAVGSNEEAARYAGINTTRVTSIAYIICGVLTAISGILFLFFTPSISASNHANPYELYGIAAAVLGGCSLRGGEGSIIGILLGTALLCVLRNIINLLSIPSSMELAIIGGVILIGVLADQLLKNRRPTRV